MSETVTKSDDTPKNVTEEMIAAQAGISVEQLQDMLASAEQARIRHTFQLGDAPRLPQTAREKAAVARWMEIDQRRYKARCYNEDPRATFRFTPAERQLKRRLLKAGLIVEKPQPKTWNARQRRQMQLAKLIGSAKGFAAAGDHGAIRFLQDRAQDQEQAKWTARQRKLRRMEPRELLAAAEDAMAKRGIQRSLPAVFRDFITAWDNASPERRARFASDYRDQLEAFCHEIGGSPKSVTGGTRDLFNSGCST